MKNICRIVTLSFTARVQRENVFSKTAKKSRNYGFFFFCSTLPYMSYMYCNVSFESLLDKDQSQGKSLKKQYYVQTKNRKRTEELKEKITMFSYLVVLTFSGYLPTDSDGILFHSSSSPCSINPHSKVFIYLCIVFPSCLGQCLKGIQHVQSLLLMLKKVDFSL